MPFKPPLRIAIVLANCSKTKLKWAKFGVTNNCGCGFVISKFMFAASMV